MVGRARVAGLLGGAAVLAVVATACAQVPADPTPGAAQPGRYVVEPKHTRILFSVSHMGFSTWYGDFTGASGTLLLNPGNPSATRLDVTVPVASVSTTSAKLDGELRSEAWFDASRFPSARFVSTRVTRRGDREAEVAGELTLHGVTRPVVLEATFNGAGVNPLDHKETVGFEGRATIRRSDFGVRTYVPLIGDEVQLILSGAFEKDAG